MGGKGTFWACDFANAQLGAAPQALWRSGCFRNCFSIVSENPFTLPEKVLTFALTLEVLPCPDLSSIPLCHFSSSLNMDQVHRRCVECLVGDGDRKMQGCKFSQPASGMGGGGEWGWPQQVPSVLPLISPSAGSDNFLTLPSWSFRLAAMGPAHSAALEYQALPGTGWWCVLTQSHATFCP